MGKVNFSDLSSWYTQLNSIRNKDGIALGSLTIPSLQGIPASASDMNTLIDAIQALQSNKWFAYANWDNIPVDVVAKNLISTNIYTKINTQLDNLELICANVTTSCITSADSTSYNSYENSTNSTSSNTTNNVGNSTESNAYGNGTHWSDGSNCGYGSPSNGVGGNSNTGWGTSCRTSTDSTCSTNSNVSKNFTTSDSTYNYNFAVVSGGTTVTNSRTSK